MSQWIGITEFVQVVQSQSFTGAARRLGVSVVNVSRRIAALEDRLGVKLLNRTTRKVSVTEAGSLFYDHCQQLVDGLEVAEQAVTAIQHTLKGKLHITAPATYGDAYIAPLINQFLQTYPELQITLTLTNRQLDLLDAGIDVAVRLGQLKDSSLVARRLASRQMHVCASASYLNQYGIPQTPGDLVKHQCLLGSTDQWRFSDKQKSYRLPVSGRLRCNSGLALLQSAKTGLGLVQLPDYYVKADLQAGRLQEVLINYRDAPEGIWAVFTEHKKMSRKVRLLITFLHQHLHASHPV